MRHLTSISDDIKLHSCDNFEIRKKLHLNAHFTFRLA